MFIIFNELNYEVYEDVVIGILEIVFEMLIIDIKVIEYIFDKYKLFIIEVKNILLMGGGFYFFDFELILKDEKLLFNGNLFRKNDVKKINVVLSFLSLEESRLLIELNEKLELSGCILLLVVI